MGNVVARLNRVLNERANPSRRLANPGSSGAGQGGEVVSDHLGDWRRRGLEREPLGGWRHVGYVGLDARLDCRDSQDQATSRVRVGVLLGLAQKLMGNGF
jgi:hypothetical protein